MRDLNELIPTTVEGIKSLAKQIAKRDGIVHHAALEVAARQAGFQNFKHATNSIGTGPRRKDGPQR